MKWTAESIPSQKNRVIIITGANAGIGRETTRFLANAGAEVIMAVRNIEKGKTVAQEIRTGQSDINLHVMPLDLSKLDSVRSFATEFTESFDRLDVLINNAGVYEVGRKTTEEGFALQMGVNHLGHFALTGLLLHQMLGTPNSRVATLSSSSYRGSMLDLNTFHTVEVADKGGYGRSKLANMLFVQELQRRLDLIKASTISVAVGPGPTKSDGAQKGIGSLSNPLLRGAADFLTEHIMSSSVEGAMPSVRAATDPEADGGDYFVPGGFMKFWGAPVATRPKISDEQKSLAKGLWERSVELTGISYSILESENH